MKTFVKALPVLTSLVFVGCASVPSLTGQKPVVLELPDYCYFDDAFEERNVIKRAPEWKCTPSSAEVDGALLVGVGMQDPMVYRNGRVNRDLTITMATSKARQQLAYNIGADVLAMIKAFDKQTGNYENAVNSDIGIDFTRQVAAEYVQGAEILEFAHSPLGQVWAVAGLVDAEIYKAIARDIAEKAIFEEQLRQEFEMKNVEEQAEALTSQQFQQ